MDTYKTFEIPTTEILFKDKNSKFYGYGFPFSSIDDLKSILDDLRKLYSGAGHFCYAYQLGTEIYQYRTNDDGEPKNSAGAPIYGQIQSHELTNVLIVIVRYFGGTKLGISGLILAYKIAAQLVIAQANVIEKTINTYFTLIFDYKNLNKVMRLIKEKNLMIVSQKMQLNCEIEIETRKKNEAVVLNIFNNLYEVSIVVKVK